MEAGSWEVRRLEAVNWFCVAGTSTSLSVTETQD